MPKSKVEKLKEMLKRQSKINQLIAISAIEDLTLRGRKPLSLIRWLKNNINEEIIYAHH